MPAYLDHAATTPVRPEAVAALLPLLTEGYGNPSGSHAVARAARRVLDDAREVVAAAVGARPDEVVFTSGGTESDNLAVLGRHDRVGGTVVCSAVEHHAVLVPVEHRGGRVVAVDRHGRIDLDALADALDPDVTLVSVMAVNNEVGAIQPIADVAKVVAEHAPNAVLHTDAVQAVPWLDTAEVLSSAALITMSGHKIGAPKGVGVLVVRDGVDIASRNLGGGQEFERRGGTQNVPGIGALAAALSATVAERADTAARVARLRDRLADGLRAEIDDLVEAAVPTGPDGRPDRSGVVPGICHICVPGISSEALLFLLEMHGVSATAASSCASGALEPSHVLAAMGVPRDLAAGSLRLSLGHDSTDADVDLALEVVPDAVRRLRAHAGG